MSTISGFSLTKLEILLLRIRVVIYSNKLNYELFIYLVGLQVLDEIHRQPLSLSLPIVSLPASESIVDSLPVKNHKRTHTTDDDEEQ